MGKWKWLTVHGYNSQGPVYITMEFLSRIKLVGGMQHCAQGFTGIMLKNDDTTLK
jgi:hypothetical protein